MGFDLSRHPHRRSRLGPSVGGTAVGLLLDDGAVTSGVALLRGSGASGEPTGSHGHTAGAGSPRLPDPRRQLLCDRVHYRGCPSDGTVLVPESWHATQWGAASHHGAL